MAISEGIRKVIAYKKETTWGTAPGATGGTSIARISGAGELTKATFQSAEIATHQQIEDFRHGIRTANYTFNGELAAGKYTPFFEAVLRQLVQSAATSGALVNVTAAATPPHFVRAAGSWITDGFRVGDVIRWSGWATPATANNAKNFLIYALTATNMSVVALDGSAVVAKAAGDSVTATVTGKKTWTPTTGHTNDSFYIEDWYPDVAQSERFSGLKIGNAAFSLPPTGIATVNLGFLGKDVEVGTAQYYTTPTPRTESGKLSAVNGVIMVNGVKSAVITALDFAVDAGLTTDPPVAGSVSIPAVYSGRVNATGTVSMLFEDGVARDAFLAETKISLLAAYTATNAANADFVAFNFPAIKLGSASKADSEQAIVQTFSFQALKSGGTGADMDTTLSIQDSLAV